MVRQSMPLNDITNKFSVHAINLRAQNTTMWNSNAKLLIYGYRVFIIYTLYPIGVIRPKPITCRSSYNRKYFTIMKARYRDQQNG